MDVQSQFDDKKEATEKLYDKIDEKQKEQEEKEMEEIRKYYEAYKEAHTPKVREHMIRRNDACPCGSGKKYKNCCMDSGKYEKYVVKE